MSCAALIATHNSDIHLMQCLRSLDDFSEICLLDDGSSKDDLSVSLARIYANVNLGRPIRISQSPKIGQTAAKLELLRATTAEAVCFTDSDDYRLPETLDGQLRLIRAGADVAIAPVVRGSDGTLITSPGDPWTMLHQANFASVGIVFRRSALLDLLEEWETHEFAPQEGAPELQLMVDLLLGGACFAWSRAPVAVCRDRHSPTQAHHRSGPVRKWARDRLLANATNSDIRNRLLALSPPPDA